MSIDGSSVEREHRYEIWIYNLINCTDTFLTLQNITLDKPKNKKTKRVDSVWNQQDNVLHARMEGLIICHPSGNGCQFLNYNLVPLSVASLGRSVDYYHSMCINFLFKFVTFFKRIEHENAVGNVVVNSNGFKVDFKF